MRTPLAAVFPAIAALLLLLLGAGCAVQPGAAPPGSDAGPGLSGTALRGTAPSGAAPSRTAPAGNTPAGRTPTGTIPTSTAAGGVFGRVFLNPDLTVADGSLYLTWALAPPTTRAPSRMTLARASVSTGQILAENDFGPGSLSVPVYAAGALWVTDSVTIGELLLRLDPRTLMVTGELKIADGGQDGAPDNRIAFAGNSLWVDGAGRLVQVSPQTVAAERVIPLPRADSSAVAASPDGRTLIVTEAVSGAGTIQRRNPRTGGLIASSAAVLGVSAPLIGGVTGGVAWIAEPTGMMGYVERYHIAGMRPDTATLVEGTNAIRAGFWDGLLWVHGADGGTRTNYCAEPGTGRRLATLPMPYRSRPVLLAADGRDFFFSYLTADGYHSRVAAAPVPAACLRTVTG